MNTPIKTKHFLIAAVSIVFVCYFALLTLFVPQFRTSYIIASVFSLIAIAMQISAILLIVTEPPIKEYFYRIPAIYVGMIYAIIQLVVGAVLSFVNLPVKPVLVIEILIFAVCGSIECYMIYAGLHARDLNDKVTEAISDMRKLSAEAKAIVDTAPDYEWRRLAKAVSDEIQYAEPVSSGSTAFIEIEIHKELDNLRDAVAYKNRDAYDESFNKIKQLLSERDVEKSAEKNN